MSPLNFEQALAKAARLCSLSEKAPQEISDKLKTWGLPSHLAEKVISRLKEDDFLNENRFAHAFVHDKFSYEHWGKVKIAYNLRSKGIPDTIIEEAMNEVIDEEDYLSVLIDLVRSKMRGMEIPLAQNDRAKIYRFAQQRGFESRFVSLALRNVGINSDEEDF